MIAGCFVSFAAVPKGAMEIEIAVSGERLTNRPSWNLHNRYTQIITDSFYTLLRISRDSQEALPDTHEWTEISMIAGTKRPRLSRPP